MEPTKTLLNAQAISGVPRSTTGDGRLASHETEAIREASSAVEPGAVVVEARRVADETFDRYDTNNDGKLSKEEVIKGAEEDFAQRLRDFGFKGKVRLGKDFRQKIADKFNTHDRNRDGVLDRREFRGLMSERAI